jgi:hypothetical protein
MVANEIKLEFEYIFMYVFSSYFITYTNALNIRYNRTYPEQYITYSILFVCFLNRSIKIKDLFFQKNINSKVRISNIYTFIRKIQ